MSEFQENAAANAENHNPEDIFSQRINKVAELKAAGIAPFGERFDGSRPVGVVREGFKLELAESAEQPAIAAGRLMAMRIMGGSIFADLKDSSGKIQLFVNKKVLGEEEFKLFKKLDIGDLIGIRGLLFVTKMGELTIKVHSCKLLSKSLRPLPEKFHGLTNIEQRYRQRYLDLIMSDESLEIFKKRFLIIREIRKYLEEQGYIEVETPMLQPLAGGAIANPFKTYYEALSSEMFMRIAPELYLKRLLVGGFEKVFELNRNFRNEGIDRRHNPEFTMVEIYQAYGDCRTMMDLIEEMVTRIALKLYGKLEIDHGNGKVISLQRPWKRISYSELIKERISADWFEITPEERVTRAKQLGVELEPGLPDFKVTNEVYEKIIEHTLIQPTFVTRMPAQLVPLAKACCDDPEFVDVFELEINGQEVAPGYSELNDPIEQRKRFMDQFERERKPGDLVSDKVDEDFLVALEHGMPPAGGMGIGIDRLVMMLTGAESIRDVVLFPQMRKK
jgi:lysyl-tRNA synthetase class 2